MNTVQKLVNKKLISPPKWLADNVMYETITGSVAYGTSSDTSDMDVYGWAIGPKDLTFPHLGGEIPGFGKQIQRFEQFSEHGKVDTEAMGGDGRTYDITIFSIVKYFQLCMDNNPNMLDTLYTAYECILHSTEVSKLVRDNRDMFLHKGSFHKFLGYAHAQLHKMNNKNPEGKRKETVEKYGYDTKYASHLIRLAYECEMIFMEQTLDLRRHSEHLKAIRRGEVPKEDILKWFGEKELQLDALYHTSTLRHKPDEAKIKALLLTCLESHYGSLDKCITIQDKHEQALKEINQVLERYKL